MQPPAKNNPHDQFDAFMMVWIMWSGGGADDDHDHDHDRDHDHDDHDHDHDDDDDDALAYRLMMKRLTTSTHHAMLAGGGGVWGEGGETIGQRRKCWPAKIKHKNKGNN